MEIVLMIIMMLVFFGFVLKLTFNGWVGRTVLCGVASAFIILTCDYATVQSKTQIAGWLSQPGLMLDVLVWLTADVVFQVCFCVLALNRFSGGLSNRGHAFWLLCRNLPGLLVFPVLFAMLTELIFALPGIDFRSAAWSMAAVLFVAVPVLSAGLKWLIPEPDIRLEMIFMTSLLVAALGIVATANGRISVVGVTHVEWDALAGVAVILLVGMVAGVVCNRYLTRKTISKIK